jgi:hypothetical protein
METQVQTFKRFLKNAFDEGNFATDDVIAFVMPLFQEVLSFHEAGLVGPFEKEETLFITDDRLDIDENFAHAPKENLTKVKSLFSDKQFGRFSIVETLKLNTDVDQGSQEVKSLEVHLNLNEPLKHAA